jgi:hypothetical protein
MFQQVSPFFCLQPNPHTPLPGRDFFRKLLILLFLGVLGCPLFATPISFTVTPNSLNASPGGTVTFVGRITNTSGASLDASDLFFNFSDYDAVSITDITQLLGNPDFTLPNNTFSAIVDLFSVTLANTAPMGTFTIDVSLEDVNNDLSATQTVSIINGNATTAATPEPGTLILCFSGALATLFLAHVSRARSNFAYRAGRGEES